MRKFGITTPMKPTVLMFQSCRDKSWRDKLEGASIFARSAGWQIHVIEHGTRPVAMRDWRKSSRTATPSAT